MKVNTSNICAIVPAAGLGRRMKTYCPKQYLPIGNKTILEYSVEALLANPHIGDIVIAINPNDAYFSSLALADHPKITIVKGGVKRANSVLAALQVLEEAQWVLVHDAVRPCLHQDDLSRLLTIIPNSKVGGILATPIKDTIKRSNFNENVIACTVNRVNLWHALTPQLFPRSLLYRCLLRSLKEGAIVTDEASALEYCNIFPVLIKGRCDNIKITYPEDLQLASSYFNRTLNPILFNRKIYENWTWF